MKRANHDGCCQMLANCRRHVLVCGIKNPFVEMTATQAKCLEMLLAFKETEKNFNEIFIVQTYITRFVVVILIVDG